MAFTGIVLGLNVDLSKQLSKIIRNEKKPKIRVRQNIRKYTEARIVIASAVQIQIPRTPFEDSHCQLKYRAFLTDLDNDPK